MLHYLYLVGGMIQYGGGLGSAGCDVWERLQVLVNPTQSGVPFPCGLSITRISRFAII